MMSGTLFALWIALSAGLLLLFFYAAVVNWRNRRVGDVDLGELIPSFLPVDLAVLHELANVTQDGHKEEKLSQEELAEIQHERTNLGAECLRRMAHNAALLQRLGYSQLQSPNPLICSLAQEMIDAGVNVRLYAFLGLAGLRLRRWFRLGRAPLPWFLAAGDVQSTFATSIIPAYQALKEKAGNLTCLKFSSLHEELAQSL
ncbi:MAG TPA: hypothetical protein VKE93_14810 [Candidatus Angelobacter sp.]|nr:hypothetical protein [Candidatus Angelobacter sp.]